MPCPVHVVLSTGRSGSTLLSELLHLHPQVLSISEFLVPLMHSGVRYADQPMSTEAFCTALSNQLPTSRALMKAGIAVPEFRYPFGKEGARYGMESGVPDFANCALAHLSTDPDTTLDQLMHRLHLANGRLVKEHLSCLFQCLIEMFGGSVIVERSGGSLGFAAQIRALLPEASIVLLTRSGPETAISMSRHAYFRHVALRAVLTHHLGFDPYTSPRRDGAERLPPGLRDQLPERFSRAGFEALQLPFDLFGSLWAHLTQVGLSNLPAQFHHIAFEALCSAPPKALADLVQAIGVACLPDWLDAASGRIAPPETRAGDLAEPDRTLLKTACAPGIAAYTRIGIH